MSFEFLEVFKDFNFKFGDSEGQTLNLGMLFKAELRKLSPQEAGELSHIQLAYNDFLKSAEYFFRILWKGVDVIKMCQAYLLSISMKLLNGSFQRTIGAAPAYDQDVTGIRSKHVQFGNVVGYFLHFFSPKLDHPFMVGRIVRDMTSILFLLKTSNPVFKSFAPQLNPVTGKYCQEKLGENIYVGRLEDTPFAQSSFNVITLWDVLEHFADPVVTLQKLKGYLKEGGMICIQSPNIESYIAKKKGKKWDWLTPGDHISHFSPETMQKTLERAGFSPVYSTTWEPSGYFIDSLLGFNEIQNPLLNIYRKTIVRIFRKLLFFLFFPIQWAIRAKDEGACIVTFATCKGVTQ